MSRVMCQYVIKGVSKCESGETAYANIINIEINYNLYILFLPFSLFGVQNDLMT